MIASLSIQVTYAGAPAPPLTAESVAAERRAPAPAPCEGKDTTGALTHDCLFTRHTALMIRLQTSRQTPGWPNDGVGHAHYD